MEEATKKVKQCHFCVENVKDIDYKDGNMLRRFINSYGKILPKKRTGTCSKHQRKLATSVKRARVMAILPFTNR
ncbi:MAG: 30S ribosomal protein S18 [bacterium]|nr:30S ribosomal protein S18 [bacterium]